MWVFWAEEMAVELERLLEVINDERLLAGAKGVLRRITSGEEESAALDEFLRQTQSEELLTDRKKELQGQSALMVLRTIIELEDKEERMREQRKGREERGRNLPEGGRSRKLRRGLSIDEEESPFRRLVILTGSEDMAALSEHTQMVHLSRQEVVTEGKVREILRVCPNLLSIQVPPSLYSLLVKGRGVEELIDAADVELRVGRVREAAHYDEPRNTGDYGGKRRKFEEAMADPERRKRIDLMLELEFDGVLAAVRYFGEETITIRGVAQEMGLPQHYVQRVISGALAEVGYPVRDVQARHEMQANRRRVEKMLAAGKEMEKVEREYMVGEYLPPRTLAVARWEMWKELVELYVREPGKLELLRREHPRQYRALVNYFQLEMLGGQAMTLEEMGEGMGISRETVRLLKNRGLTNLGVIEED